MRFAAAVAALMMVMSPLGTAFGGGGLVGTASANENTIGDTVDSALTIKDPEPGVTTTHTWREDPTSSVTTDQIVIDYDKVDVSKVGVDDVQKAGIDTNDDGQIDEQVSVQSVSIDDNGTRATFKLDGSYTFEPDTPRQIILVYGDVQHPDTTDAGGVSISDTTSSSWKSLGVDLFTPKTEVPEMYVSGEAVPEGMTLSDVTPGATDVTTAYRAGPAADGSSASVDKIRVQYPRGYPESSTALSGVSTSTVEKFGIDTDGDGQIEEEPTTISGFTASSWVSGPEAHFTLNSTMTVDPGEDVILVFSGVQNPSSATTDEIGLKYNTYAGWGSDTVTVTDLYEISGTLTDATGSAISGATVDIDRKWSNLYDVREVTTDSNGKYSVTVPASGDYQIESSSSGYSASTQTVSVSGDTTADASLETASYTYDATVEDSSGNALEGATVELLDGSGNVVSSGTTASDGTISLSAPSGTYDVEVSADGYDSASGSADISTSGASGTFTLSESTYVLDGTVTDSSGNAVENATVTLLDSSGNTVKETATASDGTYSFSGVKSGDYTVEVAASDYEAGSQTVTVSGAKTVDFSLAKTVWTNTYDRPSDGTPGKVFAEFTSSGNATVTVEAHNATSGEWETVVDAKQYTVEGSSNTTDTVEVALDDYAGEDYDQYRVTVEDVEPSNTGVAEETAGGGGTPGGDGGVPFVAFVVLGGLALAAGGAAILFEE